MLKAIKTILMIKKFKAWKDKKHPLKKDPVNPKKFTFSDEDIRNSLEYETSLDLEEDNADKSSSCCLGNNSEQECCIIS